MIHFEFHKIYFTLLDKVMFSILTCFLACKVFIYYFLIETIYLVQD